MNETTTTIEVMTNFKSNNIILKKGKFFIYVELSEVEHMLKQLNQIYNIMTTEQELLSIRFDNV